jgi:phage baseplate assembly protein W
MTMANQNSHATDIALELLHHELRPVYGISAELRRVRQKAGKLRDMALVASDDNLAQAVMMRLLTPRGELRALGHPEYGSRLHETVGMPNTETKRNLIKLYILDALAQEDRIEKKVFVQVERADPAKDQVRVHLRVIPKNQSKPLDLSPFTLEL